MNKLKNIRWKYVFYTFLIMASMVGVVLLMGLVKEKSQNQVCTEVQVMIDGKEAFIDQKDILERIKEAFGEVKGMPLQNIPVHDLENNLRELPYVSGAEIYMDMDGLMQIRVKQREARLRVINENKQEYYVDAFGAKMPVTLKYVPRVMVANGFIDEEMSNRLDTIETEVLHNLVQITQHINTDELWANQVVQLYVNENRDIELVPRVGGQRIILGDAGGLEDKLYRIKTFYQDILPRVGADAYKMVNVKYDGQIICEREDGWFLDSLQMELNTIELN